jgi:hypothetical protein
MSDANRRHLVLPALLVFFLGALAYHVVRHRTVPSAILHVDPLTQEVRGEDRKFLDDLVQKQNQDGDPLSAPADDIGGAGMIASSGAPVPRAELVIHSEIVRRGELVAVHSGKVKRKH